MITATDIAQLRGQLGAAARHGPPELAEELRLDLTAANVQAAIERLLTDAPPLSPDRAARLHQAIAHFTSDGSDLKTA